MAYKVHHWIRRFTLIKNVEISPVVFFQKLPRFYRCHFEHMFGLTLITFLAKYMKFPANPTGFGSSWVGNHTDMIYRPRNYVY